VDGLRDGYVKRTECLGLSVIVIIIIIIIFLCVNAVIFYVCML